MKSQREIYEALVNGETLINEGGIKLKLVSNKLAYEENNRFNPPYTFNDFLQWEIYVEKKWYESIPEGGVLCWCSPYSADTIKYIDNITSRKDNFFKGGDIWSNATPITKAEIQTFINNAPKD